MSTYWARLHTDSSDGADAVEWEPCQDQRSQTVWPFFFCSFWEPSSRTASSSSSVGGRRQVSSERQQVVRSDSQPLFKFMTGWTLGSARRFPKGSGFSSALQSESVHCSVPALTLHISSCWSNLTVESPLFCANPTDTVQCYRKPQLRSCVWCCVPVLASCSHNLIKHETHSVKLKIDSPLSHSQTKKSKKKVHKLVHRGADRIRDKSETFIALSWQSCLKKWNTDEWAALLSHRHALDCGSSYLNQASADADSNCRRFSEALMM